MAEPGEFETETLVVRVESHLIFREEAEPEGDSQVQLLAQLFAYDFGQTLQLRTDGVVRFTTARGQKTSSGIVEVLFLCTYYTVQTAVNAKQIFDVLYPLVQVWADERWHTIGAGILRTQNRVVRIDLSSGLPIQNIPQSTAAAVAEESATGDLSGSAVGAKVESVTQPRRRASFWIAAVISAALATGFTGYQLGLRKGADDGAHRKSDDANRVPTATTQIVNVNCPSPPAIKLSCPSQPPQPSGPSSSIWSTR